MLVNLFCYFFAFKKATANPKTSSKSVFYVASVSGYGWKRASMNKRFSVDSAKVNASGCLKPLWWKGSGWKGGDVIVQKSLIGQKCHLVLKHTNIDWVEGCTVHNLLSGNDVNLFCEAQMLRGKFIKAEYVESIDMLMFTVCKVLHTWLINLRMQILTASF